MLGENEHDYMCIHIKICVYVYVCVHNFSHSIKWAHLGIKSLSVNQYLLTIHSIYSTLCAMVLGLGDTEMR